MLRLLAIWFLITISFTILSQTYDTDFFQDPVKNERFDAGVPVFSGILLPLYSPEMKFSLGSAAVVTFKTRRNNPDLWHSSFPVLFAVNPDGSFRLDLKYESFWLDNLIIFNVDADYRKMIDNYWGTGMEHVENIQKGETTTEFRRNSFYLRPAALVKLVGKFYFGLSADFNRMTALNPADLMLEDPDILAFGTEIYSAGYGIIALYDTKDRYNPSAKGFYIKAGGTNYSDKLGSDYHFQQIAFDFRQFLPIIRPGSILALQLKTTLGIGDVPWAMMPQPGGPDDLRGYYQGKYRDRNAMVLIAEYRHLFLHKGNDTLSRHGIVYWLGGATVFHEISAIRNVILSTGIGYRYRLQPGITLRIDIGFGTENVGIYRGLNESF